MEVGRLFVSIFADDSEFQKGMGNVQKGLADTGKKVSGAGASLTKNVTAPIIAVGAAAVGLANKYAGMGDDIAKTSTKLGISTDALQEMDYWATQNGLSAESMERAVGRLNQRIGRAALGNDKYSQAFADLGVEITDVNGKVRDTEDVMSDTIENLMDIEDASLRSAMASEVFGTKMARDLMPALEDGSMTIEEAKERVHELGGVMSEEAVRAAEKYQDSMDDLKRQFSGVFMELANKLIPIITDQLVPAIQNHVLPAISAFIGFIGDLVSWFQDLNPTVKKVIGFVVGLAVVLGPILMVVGKIISVFAVLVPIIKGVAAVFLFLASPIGLIIAAIGLLVAAFIYLWNNNEAFRDGVIAIWNKIKSTAEKIWIGLQLMFNAVADAIKKIWDKHGKDIMKVLNAAWDQVKNIVETAINIVKGIIALVTAVIQGDWEGAWDAIQSITDTIVKFVVRSVENLSSALSGIWNVIRDYAIKAWETLRSAIQERVNNIRQAVINGIQSALDWIRGLPSQMRSMGRDMIQGMINGIRNMAGRLVSAAKNVVSNAVDAAKNLLKIGSPSKVFEDMGGNIGEGMARGIAATAGIVSRATEGMTGASMGAAAPAGGGGTITVRHELDLRNVPDSVDGESLEARLMEALNNPQVKRKLDRVAYQNKTSSVRGLGG